MKGAHRGPAPGKLAPRKSTRVEATDDRAEDADFSVPDSHPIVPADQLKLTPKELDEDITRVLTATNPLAPHNMVHYSFTDREFKPVPSTAMEHTVFHFRMASGVLHVDSADAAAQRASEKAYRAGVEDKRRDRVRAAQEAAAAGGASGSSSALASLMEGGGGSAAGGSPEDSSGVGGAGGGGLEAAELQRNQFNYTSRACQTFNPPVRNRTVSTQPPVTSTASGTMSQWRLADAYHTEYERLLAAASADRTSSSSSSTTTTAPATGASSSSTPAAAAPPSAFSPGQSDPMHSEDMGRALRLLERVMCQNAEDEVYADFRYWEDASDKFRGTSGTCLPLWRFEGDARTKRKMVTAVTWNRAYPDLFAVGYGSYDYMKQGSGMVSVYSLKNVGRPEYAFSIETGVLSLDFHPANPALLVAGCYDGTVKVFDVRRRENRAVFSSDVKTGKHTDPVWDVRWAAGDAAGAASPGELSFFSVSADGRVACWTLAKSELRMEVLVTLKPGAAGPWTAGAIVDMSPGGGGGAGDASLLPSAGTLTTTSQPGTPSGGLRALVSDGTAAPVDATAAAGGSRGDGALLAAAGAPRSGTHGNGLSGGTCLAFHPLNERIFLVGTEDGQIHKCSLDCSGSYLASFPGHKMAVYAVRWNAFHPRVFISSSADWTIKLWDDSFVSGPVMSWDIGSPVGDVCWAPYSSTVFSAVTDEGRVQVWDLHVDKHASICDQKIVKKAKCTHIAFNPRVPVILASDSAGSVMSLKLSPNLRRITPIPQPVVKKGEVPPPPPTREEVEIRKLDALLELSDANIKIVTPIPGLVAAARLAAANGTAGKGADEEA